MNKFIIFILIVAALLFGGKFGLEYHYSKKLDEFINHARIVADINYQNIRIGTDGSITINNLSVQPNTVATLVRMGEITLFSSDRLLPINLTSFIKRNEFPDELGIRIADLEYDPRVFETAIQQDDECRYIETTMRAELTGINRLNADIEASININPSYGVINISSTDQTAEMALQASFDASLLNPNSSSQTTQPIKEINAKYKLNEQVATQLIQTCASQLAMSTGDYLNNVVGSPNYLRSMGANFGADANQAMIDVMQGGKWLSINSKPSSQLNNLNNLSFYQAKDIVRLLGLKMAVDTRDVALNISDLELNSAEDIAQLATGSDETEAASISDAQIEIMSKLNPADQARIKLKLEETSEANSDKYNYQITPIGNLNRYINYSVIFKRSGDMKTMSGRLISIQSGGVKPVSGRLTPKQEEIIFTIETNQYGGKAQFNISSADVVEVQVYR